MAGRGQRRIDRRTALRMVAGAGVTNPCNLEVRIGTPMADVIEAAGGNMVEAAVMDMVPPHAHKVPLLLAGPRAGDAAEALIEECGGFTTKKLRLPPPVNKILKNGLQILSTIISEYK